MDALDTSPTSEEGPTGQTEKLLTATEVADFLNVHPNYVYEQAKKGAIPSYKFGGHRRFLLREVEEWLDRQRERSYSEPNVKQLPNGG